MKPKAAILAALAVITLALVLAVVYQSQTSLRRENEALRQESVRVARLAADNQRLSNTLAQTGRAQASANEQLQELIRLRSEVSRLRVNQPEAPPATPSEAPAVVTELAALRAEVERLTEENEALHELREQLEQLRDADLRAQEEDAAASEALAELERALAIRVIRTQVDTFPEKLKRSVAARDDEPFQDVFSRFLQTQGIETNGVSAAVFDERTGSVIVRATPAALDQVERVTTALNQEP